VKDLCELNEKAERKGRNPATGENMMLEARRVVTFKCSGKLRKRVNEKKYLLLGQSSFATEKQYFWIYYE